MSLPFLLPMQEFVFGLDSGATIVAHIQFTGSGQECTASFSEAMDAPLHGRFLPTLPLQAGSGSLPAGAFSALTTAVRTKAGRTGAKLAWIDNPNNCELVSAGEQRAIAGQDVEIRINGAAA